MPASASGTGMRQRVVRAVALFLVILVSFVIAETISRTFTGIFMPAGPASFVTGTVLFAAIFFAVLSLAGRIIGVQIFRPD